ncbi:MAG: pyruvate kinase [bacterium]|nr:MAG: pyruvate kinase [bacterium]
MIGKLMDVGVNYFRLNFSHGDQSSHQTHIQHIRKLSRQKNIHVGILADLQGPKIRIGEIEGGSIDLNAGDRLRITTLPGLGNQKEVSTTYSLLPQDVTIGDHFLLDDGLLSFKVISIDEDKVGIECEVVYGGRLKSKKGINLPNVNISAPALTEEDKKNALFAIEQDVDYFALSFVRQPSDIQLLKELIRMKSKSIPVIATIERREALENIEEIIDVADGLMVERGDLGVEIPAERVPLTQKSMIRLCNIMGKPVITATQMLESMIHNARPTRAEVSDVANAILDGTDAVMLSGETAVGSYPVEAVQKMVAIANEIECTFPVLYSRRHGMAKELVHDIEESIALGACEIAKNLDVTAIIAWTQNGHAIRLLSKYHPVSPIIALATSEKIARQVQLSWGILSEVIPEELTDELQWMDYCNNIITREMNDKRDLVIITETQDHDSKDKMNSLKVLSLSFCRI